MSPTNPEKDPTYTRIEETGTFKRVYLRKGKQKKVKTQRTKKNNKKVVLARMGKLELYVIPYDFPDSVFIGQYPNFTQKLDKYEIPKLLVFFNKARWYLNGSYLEKPKKGSKKRFYVEKSSALLQKAFSSGIDNVKEAQKKPR